MRPTTALQASALLLLAACGGGAATGDAPPPPKLHQVGGTVTGLAGTGLVLQNEGRSDLGIGAGAGSFAFVGLAEGASYAVTVRTQPANPAQRCDVAGGAGTVGSVDVTSVAVSCTTLGSAITIGGTVSGLSGQGLVLRLGSATRTLAPGTSAFTFPGELTPGAAWAVTIDAQPYLPWQTCTVLNGSGTATAAVTDVAVICASNPCAVSGQVSGYLGSGLVLQLDDRTPLVLPAGATSFAFPPLPSMTGYTLKVAAQPTGPAQVCTVVSAGGPNLPPASATSQVTFQDNTNALVDCGVPGDAVGGTVAGLTGAGLTLLLNGGPPLAVPAGATTFVFPSGVPAAARYGVTIATQPSGQACILTHAKGVKGPAEVSSVGVTCFTGSPDPLTGTYSHAPGSLRSYLTFWPDGTYSHAGRDENPDCPSRGDSVEYGVYRYQASTGAFSFEDTPTDGDGSCGFVHGGGANLRGTLTRAAGAITLTSSGTGRAVTWDAVASTPGTLTGAFSWAYGPSAGTDGSFAVFQPDGTFLLAEAQQGASGGFTVGYQRACHTAGAASLTVSTAATCRPDGQPVVITSDGGIDPGVAVPFTVTGPDTVVADGAFLLTRIPSN